MQLVNNGAMDIQAVKVICIGRQRLKFRGSLLLINCEFIELKQFAQRWPGLFDHVFCIFKHDPRLISRRSGIDLRPTLAVSAGHIQANTRR